MKCMRAALLAATLTASSSGCGTVCNLASKDPDNFGGVQWDLRQMTGGASSDAGADQVRRPSYGWAALYAFALFGADASLSFVADSMTLPLVIHLRQKHEAATSSESSSGG